MLAAAAAVVLAAGAVALLRGPDARAPEAPVARGTVRPFKPSTLPSPLTTNRSEPVRAATGGMRPAPRRVAPRPSPEIPIASEPGADDSPMAPVEPIEPAPLGLAPMPAEALTIAPLRMDPMQIVPLAEPRSE